MWRWSRLLSARKRGMTFLALKGSQMPKWWDRFVCWLTGGQHWFVMRSEGVKAGIGWRVFQCTDCGKIVEKHWRQS